MSTHLGSPNPSEEIRVTQRLQWLSLRHKHTVMQQTKALPKD